MHHPFRRLAAGAAVALAVPLLWTGSASAGHFTGYDSVVSKKIDVDHTIFDAARGEARDQWEDAGVVDIDLDTGWTNADVEYRDTTNGAVTWVGLYTNQSGDDTITFNRFWMDGMTDAQQRNVALHETGHALGLGDHNTDVGVMYKNNSSRDELSAHDHADYDWLWG